ncbi:hypothetical protein FAI40_01770 [Acetobacteraceae bacterium]|nr:hypothetical protein FAI40_01770 [Acetobacteraceae bacterium]
MSIAQTKYNDFTGSVAADIADNTSILNWLASHHNIAVKGTIVSIDAWYNYSENSKPVEMLSLKLTIQDDNNSEHEIQIKKIPVSIFLGCFKRLQLKLNRT